MITQIRRSVVLALLCLVFFGLLYPLAGTGVSQVLFKHQADGSITANGSTLIGQDWTSPKFFHGRPDDFGPYAGSGDNPLVANGKNGESGSTNLGPRSKVLVADTKALIAYWHKMGVNPTPDLVTTSGSGLDPDIAPADAYAEVPMVSKATGLSPHVLDQLIAREIRSAELGFLGSDYIDVLQLNEALAKME
ncbi:MAG: potassium-transporting ATPase subunit C [Acidimicrobiales bacterium]|jgi:K+-transporting ATPase ATPase C chain